MICVIIDNILVFPFSTDLVMIWLYLEFLVILEIIPGVILMFSKPSLYLKHHIITIPKHKCGTPNINKNIGSAMLHVS